MENTKRVRNVLSTCSPMSGCCFAMAYSRRHTSFSKTSHSSRQSCFGTGLPLWSSQSGKAAWHNEGTANSAQLCDRSLYGGEWLRFIPVRRIVIIIMVPWMCNDSKGSGQFLFDVALCQRWLHENRFVGQEFRTGRSTVNLAESLQSDLPYNTISLLVWARFGLLSIQMAITMALNRAEVKRQAITKVWSCLFIYL